jgi:hypothetical protein
MLLRWWQARITGYLHLHGVERRRDRADGARPDHKPSGHR